MMNWLGSLDFSRSLQTSSIINFVISLYLVFQMSKDIVFTTLHGQQNEALDKVTIFFTVSQTKHSSSLQA